MKKERVTKLMANLRKKLSVTYPIITSYPEHADLLSVLCNYEDCLPWIMSNYIQIYIYNDWSLAYFFPHNNFYLCPCIEYQRIGKNIIKKSLEVIKFIKNCIDMNYYIFLTLDQFYIKASQNYQKNHIMHPTLIYGYDQEEKSINIADFYNNGKYIFTSENFKQIKLSFREEKKSGGFYRTRYYGLHDIILFKYNDDLKYNLNIKLVFELLTDYINASNTDKISRTYETQRFGETSINNCTFGIDIYNVILNYFSKDNFEVNFGFLRTLFVLSDHKKLMLARIDYFYKNGIINKASYDQLYPYFLEIKNEMKIIVNLFLKYKITSNYKIINGIITKVTNIGQKEKYALELLLDSISKYI